MASKEVTNAAKAIYESRNGAGRTPWSQLPWSHKVPYLDDAEAARKSFFAALQEPTEGMCLAALYKSKSYLNRDIWTAMLAASALGEQSE
ncbi:HMG-box domain-containing protein [Ochrobactrum chromiisoli]|uniref:Uncharacterized protein n=1 Tax=Ochrobactrum chromiisoli TaxID=2993941 RepID=A0ABT3QQI8_9HYPH|nr:hypothetical protein [Ochrobactrum chromiisoli]MCX2697871.1 hypothetical protein [Ochrobactrum chromiisoli]